MILANGNRDSDSNLMFFLACAKTSKKVYQMPI